MKKYIGFILTGIIASVLSIFLMKTFAPRLILQNHKYNQTAAKVSQVSYNPQTGIPMDFIEASEIAVNAVVHIKTEFMQEHTGYLYDPFQDFFWGNGTRRYKNYTPVMASGSGVIVSSDGFIVTNRHVIKNADKIHVILNNKKEYDATVIGKDPSTDIALLKIDENNLDYLPYGNSDEVKVGQWVLAVGNPFNLTSTVTAGIVSAKGRNINILNNDPNNNLPAVESFIQTDAAVNPGNSGGALVSADGQLIGINTAIQSNTGSYTGYAFAIPVNLVKKVVNDLLEYGSVQRAFIGVSIRNIDNDLAKDIDVQDYSGVYVSGLMQNGAAEIAGLKIGDIITQVNGKEVTKVSELQEQVSNYSPGDKITVKVRRKGTTLDIPVELKNSLGKTDLVKAEDNNANRLLGAQIDNVSDDLKEKLNIDEGVQIRDVGSGRFRSTGIRNGFIITKVNKLIIHNFGELKDALSSIKGGVLIGGIYPNGVKAYYGFGI